MPLRASPSPCLCALSPSTTKSAGDYKAQNQIFTNLLCHTLTLTQEICKSEKSSTWFVQSRNKWVNCYLKAIDCIWEVKLRVTQLYYFRFFLKNSKFCHGQTGAQHVRLVSSGVWTSEELKTVLRLEYEVWSWGKSTGLAHRQQTGRQRYTRMRQASLERLADICSVVANTMAFAWTLAAGAEVTKRSSNRY